MEKSGIRTFFKLAAHRNGYLHSYDKLEMFKQKTKQRQKAVEVLQL
ncbi:hypothetical protein OAN61_00880 [bacterium]|nr:hypothetical protein [bacterium]